MTTWMTLREAAAYGRISLRSIERAVARSFNTLPSHLVEGRRLVRQDEYDRWATQGRAIAESKTSRALQKLGL